MKTWILILFVFTHFSQAKVQLNKFLLHFEVSGLNDDGLQRVPKKMSFLGKIAITTLKLIQNANAGGVLENSGYLLPDGH